MPALFSLLTTFWNSLQSTLALFKAFLIPSQILCICQDCSPSWRCSTFSCHFLKALIHFWIVVFVRGVQVSIVFVVLLRFCCFELQYPADTSVPYVHAFLLHMLIDTCTHRKYAVYHSPQCVSALRCRDKRS